MPWARREFNGNEVWVHVDRNGAPRLDREGRAEMAYQLPATKVYRPNPRNLGPAPPRASALGARDDGLPDLVEDEVARPAPARMPDNAVIIYTDGACTGNPGPMGIGVVVMDGAARREVSEFLGEGTNNIAELTAILRALEIAEQADRSRPVVVHSDSTYAIGLLSKGWKPKANQELVGRLREVCRGFRDLRFVKVAGHAGVPENERCDALAREAIVSEKTWQKETKRG